MQKKKYIGYPPYVDGIGNGNLLHGDKVFPPSNDPLPDDVAEAILNGPVSDDVKKLIVNAKGDTGKGTNEGKASPAKKIPSKVVESRQPDKADSKEDGKK